MTLLLCFFATAWLTRSWLFGLGVVLFVGGVGRWLGPFGLWCSIVVVVCAVALYRIEHARR